MTLPIVVVDDSVRFALHVWRCLSRSIVIGIGNTRCLDDQLNRFWDRKAKTPKPLFTPDGRFEVWWVSADGSLNDRMTRTQPKPPPKANDLPQVLNAIRGEAVFLIDVRGKGEYSAEAVYNSLVSEKGARNWRVVPVSSYQTGFLAVEPPARIHPKSPETIKSLADIAPNSSLDTPRKSAHVLVTGAGFEICDRDQGSFGPPSTAELLKRTWEAFAAWRETGSDTAGKPWVLTQTRSGRSRSFPVPSGHLLVDDEYNSSLLSGDDFDELHKLAGKRDLDGYFDFLLSTLLRAQLDRTSIPFRRTEEKARDIEYRIRDAFRNAIRQDDLGQLNQCLDAANLPWLAWLSTNYTGFADRALAALSTGSPSPGDGRGPRLWQVVPNSGTALALRRELLHSWETQGSHAARSGKVREMRNRPAKQYLFKLHGDIADLQTMAIAGHDKEIYNHLALPIDDLHEIYIAATLFFDHQFASQNTTCDSVIWHIVGHALRDRPLLNLIGRVARRTIPTSYFIIVNPGMGVDGPKAVQRRLLGERRRERGQERGEKRGGAGDWIVVESTLTARQYLARLALTGLPDIENKRDLQRWAGHISSSFTS